jgi:hypothetical protein
MPGKVFLSCGQRPPREKKVAQQIKKLLEDKFDLDCYVAINIQGLNDIMKITDELKSSDYYLFVDFFRKGEYFLCYLFTHQEFVLAHHLGFKDMIAFKENGVPSEGFIKYVQANPEPFKTDEELLKKIEIFVRERKWNKDYSRNLIVDHIERVGPIQYGDQTGSYLEHVWHAYILNRRPDVAAVDSVCILDSIEFPDKIKKDCDDRSYLKWAKQMSYRKTILPQDYGVIDIFAIHANERGVFLHSEWDMRPRQPIIKDDGKYKLHYKVFSEGFPLLPFCVEVNYRFSKPIQLRWDNSTKVKLIA